MSIVCEKEARNEPLVKFSHELYRSFKSGEIIDFPRRKWLEEFLCKSCYPIYRVIYLFSFPFYSIRCSNEYSPFCLQFRYLRHDTRNKLMSSLRNLAEFARTIDYFDNWGRHMREHRHLMFRKKYIERNFIFVENTL